MEQYFAYLGSMWKTIGLQLLMVAVFAASLCLTSNAQEEDTNPRFVRLVLNDGTIKEGELVSVDDDFVVLNIGALGTTRIPKYEVESLQDIESLTKVSGAGSRAYAVNPQASRYFFAPSGIQMKKNEGYFQSNIVLNSVSYGFTDGLTIGGIVSFLGGGGSLKFGTSIGERTYISAGGIGFVDFYGILDEPLGLGFANITRGDERSNITFNLGFGNRVGGRTYYRGYYPVEVYGYTEYYPSEKAESETRPLMVNVSAMAPLGDTRWLITENYLIRNRVHVDAYTQVTSPEGIEWQMPTGAPMAEGTSWGNDSAGIVSLGIRSLNRRTGWLWDYGLVGVFSGGDGFAAPWFSFTLAF